MRPKFSKTIGIVGGAGPMASAFLYTTLIELCQKQYGANDYNDFPEIILESYPFIRGDAEKIRRDIASCFAKLQGAGADLFCIASHSFHGYLPDVPQLFVNLVSESLQEASRLRIVKPLILAAQATIDLKLYGRAIYPPEKDQQLVQKLIREVAGGVVTKIQSDTLQEMIHALHHQFLFDGIILACTELPLIHRKFPLSGTPVIDTVEVLAQRLLVLAATQAE